MSEDATEAHARGNYAQAMAVTGIKRGALL